jgi:hypothetical protein
VVTICTASLTFNNSAFCPHSLFMCFVWISEQTAIISLCNINWLVCIIETECVYCALRAEYLSIIQVGIRPKKVKRHSSQRYGVTSPFVCVIRRNKNVLCRYTPFDNKSRAATCFGWQISQHVAGCIGKCKKENYIAGPALHIPWSTVPAF